MINKEEIGRSIPEKKKEILNELTSGSVITGEIGDTYVVIKFEKFETKKRKLKKKIDFFLLSYKN